MVGAQLTFTTNDGALTITGCIGAAGAVVVPTKTNGYFITSIGTNAFLERTDLTSLTLADSITNIGDFAFDGCTALESLIIPSSVATIGPLAFASCIGLTNVAMIDGNLLSIGASAFNGCVNLTTLNLPNSVTNVGQGAFLGTGLTRVTFGDHLVSIGVWAFSGTSLTNVAIPASITFIAGPVFGSAQLVSITVDTNNPVYSSVDGVLFDKSQTMLIQYPPARVRAYAIPNGVTVIGSQAFGGYPMTSIGLPDTLTNIESFAFGSSHLTSVNVPQTVASIGLRAFIDCRSLTNAVIGEGTTTIGQEIFTGCTDLAAITVDALNPVFSSLDGMLFDKQKITLVESPEGRTGTVVVPENVTQIGANAFANSRVSEVVILATVTNVGDGAFWNSGALSGVYFRGDAPTVGSRVFFFDKAAMVYYLPETTGWGPAFGGSPTAPWSPIIQASSLSSGSGTNRFGFTVSWARGMKIIVEGCTNLANPIWFPLETNTLTGDSHLFNDPLWTNYPVRLYRVRWP